MRLQGASCHGSCLCGWLSRHGPGMTRLVVVWGLKAAGASFEIGGFLLIGIGTSPISTVGVVFMKFL